MKTSRRQLLTGAAVSLAFLSLGGQALAQTASGKKTLIVFYSWSGNTRFIAQEIQKQTGADIFEVQLVKPYPADYNTCVEQAKRDQEANARPQLANRVENMAQYDTILFGYPNWWHSIPMHMATFLESYDLKGKRIIPFCSHGGGGLANTVDAIRALAPESEIGSALSVYSRGRGSLPEDITEWLKDNKVL